MASTENGASPRLSLAIGIWFCLGELDQLGARVVPFAPGGDDLDVGLQRIVAELEAHLVVALAGRAVGDRIGADLLAISIWRLAISGRAIEVPSSTGPRRARWRGTSGRRSRARTPRAGPR